MTEISVAPFKEPAQTQMMNRLWEYQLKNGYISDENISKLAKTYRLSEIEVEGVVSFYHFFHRKPTGKYTIYVNDSIVAEHSGYKRIIETFERETGAAIGSVDRTGTFGYSKLHVSDSVIMNHRH
jgi:[NiFe] hydrogenase diaphorase moiety large subunit